MFLSKGEHIIEPAVFAMAVHDQFGDVERSHRLTIDLYGRELGYGDVVNLPIYRCQFSMSAIDLPFVSFDVLKGQFLIEL